MYYVYWIISDKRSYIGATVNLERRIRQHNGELSGGAKKTQKGGPWKYYCTINGFRNWKEALQFEWAFKYYSRHCKSIESRRNKLNYTMSKERWTSNSPLSTDVPLTVTYLM